MRTNEYKAVRAYVGARGKTELGQVYKTCNTEKIVFWEKCKKAALEYNGELRIIKHTKQEVVAAILYKDGENWRAVAFFMDGRYKDFFVGTTKTIQKIQWSVTHNWYSKNFKKKVRIA